MNQEVLNKANISEWEYENKYEQLFQLALTAKHALSVGKWEVDGYSGVDLRRWSYDKSKSLGEGISLFENIWLKIYEKIVELNAKNLFSSYSEINNNEYIEQFKIDKYYTVKTNTFVPPSGNAKPFFCITMFNNKDKIVYKGKFAPARIMIRFDTINDFLINCKEYNIVQKENSKAKTVKDQKTGKKLF